MTKLEIATKLVNALNTQKGTQYTPYEIESAFDNNDGSFCICTTDFMVYTVSVSLENN